ncbi:MAG TPA: MerR family DNA-binding transcriptional regulator [Streptosporangiaceae bacterium]|nr:MerR family DNA-binding transcriptional regulator [Streptosporangiaceae bacterium]
MLTIGQLAAYAGVTVRAVRHYHQIGLLPEPERDASGYRRYGATAVVSLISYLDRLREIGASERMVDGERDGWILVAARWPDRIREWMPGKFAQLDDPQLVRLYRVLSEILDSDAGDDDPRLEEAADIMAGLFEQAYTSGEIDLGEVAHDDLAFDLLDALAVESDPRAERMLDLMRERGWAGWTRLERLAEPPD